MIQSKIHSEYTNWGTILPPYRLIYEALKAFSHSSSFPAGLGEFRIRDLNDEINKLLREKGHWEVRIKELGGPDYGRVGPKVTDMDGQEAPGNRYT